MILDYLIKNAVVFDGMSPSPQRVTAGVRGQRIVHVGEELADSAARTVIEGQGLYLCPGFIDTHASTGLGYTLPHAGDHKLFQGVTTEIIGNCGTSPAPVGELLVEGMHELAGQIGFEFCWRSLGEWFDQIEQHGLPMNCATFAGHNTIRRGVVREAENIAAAESRELFGLVDQAMREGALGLSTGLVYAPGSFAETGEVIECAKIAAQYGGLYASHIRNEREGVEAAVEEALAIGKAAGIRVLISHLKAAEKPNWGKVTHLIERIEQARHAGQEVTFEVYPYTATSTKLSTFLPKEILRDGVDALPAKLHSEAWRNRCIAWLNNRETRFEQMVMITESLLGAQGKSIAAIAKQNGRPPAATVLDLLIADPAAWIVYHCIAPEDMDAAIMWPDSIICSDSWSYPANAKNSIGNPHPRTYGAFTRFLERYALRRQRIPFGEAVKKITSIPADFAGLPHRGRIRSGDFADLVLLDPASVEEKATYENPRQFSAGTAYVWVNGTLMIEDGVLLDRLPGQIIRRARHAR